MKNLKNLGIALTKAEQKTINGGRRFCDNSVPCPNGACCVIQGSNNNGPWGFCDARVLC